MFFPKEVHKNVIYMTCVYLNTSSIVLIVHTEMLMNTRFM